ncbi:hypothetical protein NliqN6_6825 [Naganishia liquefaciens]|uniref:Tubulin-specific chaperone D n=1 Tax=Naganishia liquefaciens TaxID=104408 RepID=A0A8H3U0V8_9TREE|nr:hypothetical protein NliqN6_6825 [Naganishia liquefaciens]
MTTLSFHFHALWHRRREPGAVYSNTKRIARVGRLVNWVIKVRGRKHVVTHFPPEITHLPVLVYLLSPPETPSETDDFPCHAALAPARSWEIRAVCFLWFSLLLTVPFTLSAFDESSTSDKRITSQVLAIGKRALDVPSKEGEYAAIALARLLARSDGVGELDGFLAWVRERLVAGGTEGDAVFTTHILALFALLPSLLPTPKTHLPMLWRFYESTLSPHVGTATASSNGLLRKMNVKARGRWWVAWLNVTMGEAGRMRRRTRGVSGPRGTGTGVLQSLDYEKREVETQIEQEEEQEFEPPEGLEEEIDALMDSLSDKDTIVRYSAAKYLSRLADLLPRSLSSQIVESTISLFGGTLQDPLVETERGKVVDPGGGSNGEAKWHGLCLALAEMGRRGLIENEVVDELLGWAVKALNFDIRRGAHSIGSNVRDAAAYLIWSLARALSPTTIRPFTLTIAQTLVCVACFDREVGIRRAASAAFQEHAGRMGLFPHGIDVLRKTDFYAVSVRRSAFLVAAPQVAIHEEYRAAMLEHLHYTTLRHWDPAMRLIGAQSLKLICELEPSLPEQALRIEVAHLTSVEPANIHGALVAINELARIFCEREDHGQLADIFASLRTIRPSVFTLPGSDLLLEAACHVITNGSCSQAFTETSNVEMCKRILDLSMKSRKEEVQSASAAAFGALSRYRDCTADIKSCIAGARTGRPAQKQSFAMALGQADYSKTPVMLQPALNCLLSNVSVATKAPQQDVETRRASYLSILAIIHQTETFSVALAHEDFERCFHSFLDGLDDFSTDQRGDVGSWIRATCAQALPFLVRVASRIEGRLGRAGIFEAVRGLLKLVVEKLETVRVAAGPALREILAEQAGELDMESVHRHILTIEDWKDVQTLYPIVGDLLAVESVQQAVFEGLVLSLGGKNLATQNAAATTLTRTLDPRRADPHLIRQLTAALLAFGARNLTKQRIFTPVLMTAYELAQAEVWNVLEPASECTQDLLKLVNLAARGLGVIKNMDRLTSALKLYVPYDLCTSAYPLANPTARRLPKSSSIVACLTVPVAQKTALRHIPSLLSHAFPRIRTLTAEQIYLALQTMGIEDPALDERLLGTPWAEQGHEDAGKEVVRLLATVL